MRLKDKTAIVTGGGAGIGEGICFCLAREGADVVVSDIQTDAAEKVAAKVREMGRKSLVVKTDVRSPEECENLVTTTLEEMGRLDIMVCNAGVSGVPNRESKDALNIENISPEEWDFVLDINLKGVFLCNRAVAPHFKKMKYGKIVNMSSTAGRRGNLLPPYCSSKAGVIVFSQSVAIQLAPYNVNVNTICPGMVWTPMWSHQAAIWQKIYPEYKDMSVREVFDKVMMGKTPPKQASVP